MHLSLFAPAKLNLFLAITGRREDGFHDLVSVVAPLTLGDALSIELRESRSGGARFELTCNDPMVPADSSNLVIRAAQAFAEATGWKGGARFRLEKQVPAGAGLGGGSSDGVATLRGLNQLCGGLLGPDELVRVAASLGSDCPLFLRDGPVVMRGRGERIEGISDVVARRLRGQRVLVFKPAFGVATIWAYRRMAEMAAQRPADPARVYLAAVAAEDRLARWMNDATAPIEALLFNNLEQPVFAKHLALPTLLEQLRDRYDLTAHMTGSGSACFAFLSENAPIPAILGTIRAAWGASAFVAETSLA